MADLFKSIPVNNGSNTMYTVYIHDEVGSDGGTNSAFFVGSDPSSAFSDADKDNAVQAFANSLASGEGRSVVSITKISAVESNLSLI